MVNPTETPTAEFKMEREAREAAEADERSAEAAARKPQIIMNGGDEYNEKMDEAIAALMDWNAPAEDGMRQFYSRAERPMLVARDEDGHESAAAVDKHNMRYALAEAATWMAWKGKDDNRKLMVIDPPLAYSDGAINLVLRLGELPPLHSISPHPLLVRDDAGAYSLRTERGYADGRLITAGLRAPIVSADAAVNAMRDLYHDLPLASGLDGADFAAMVAMGLAAMVKPAVGCIPLFAFVKPTPGTGGTLAMQSAATAALGMFAPMNSPPSGGKQEENKAVFASLLLGQPYLLYDNMVSEFGAGTVNAALTAQDGMVEGRILGETRIIKVRVSSVLALSSNGVTLAGDMVRRTIPVQLARAHSRPSHYMPAGGWRHNLPGAAANPKYQAALASLVYHWVGAGARMGEHEPIGGYENFAGVIAGILAHAGVRGWLAGRREWTGEHDKDTAGWEAIAELWLETDGGAERTAAQLEAMLTSEETLELPFALKEGEGESAKRSRQSTIGRQFNKAATANGRIVEARDELWRIRKETVRKRSFYALEPVGERIETDAPDGGGEPDAAAQADMPIDFGAAAASEPDMPAGGYRNAAWWAQRWGETVMEAGKRLAAMVESGRMLERTAQGGLGREYALAEAVNE